MLAGKGMASALPQQAKEDAKYDGETEALAILFEGYILVCSRALVRLVNCQEIDKATFLQNRKRQQLVGHGLSVTTWAYSLAHLQHPA